MTFKKNTNTPSEPIAKWLPEKKFIKTTNLWNLMVNLGFNDYPSFHHWSITHYPEYWLQMILLLHIVFDKKYKTLVDLSAGIESPHWLPDARLNIAKSCFNAEENKVAIIEQTLQGKIKKTTYGELDKLSNRIANRIQHYLKPKDRVAVIMPMRKEAVAIYLGLIKAGCCVVSIADSFAAPEIASRLRIADTKAVFTQDHGFYHNQPIPLYEKMIDAHAPFTIVIPAKKQLDIHLRQQDISWEQFINEDQNDADQSADEFKAVSGDPNDFINILFSSGTSGEPKAIPWTHTTPIKCASDAYLHLNVKSDDILCVPTNLGWMMGPWLVFASMINQATMALYPHSYNERIYGEFIQNAKVSILGVFPTLVKKWHTSHCMANLDWHTIKLFVSTGECSQPNDILYLSTLAKGKPVIEYCGGTEIGGAYITSTVIEPLAPSAFTTPALGIDFKIIDQKGLLSEHGEVVLVPPSIGLSTKILNQNHHQIYYAKLPKLADYPVLRRHGDQIEHFENGFYRILGRVDDTMNLGGIKTSSTEIESVLHALPNLSDVAAIAISPADGGPSQLIIYAVPKLSEPFNAKELKKEMQNAIKQSLNPLFKIQDVVFVDALPRTETGKLLHRVLRDQYQSPKEMKKIISRKGGKKKICLALQGGGAYGAYTWGILDKFLENEQLEIDAISATSAGSVNAAILANGMREGGHRGARKALKDFWETLSFYGSYYSPVRPLLPVSLGMYMPIDFGAQASFLLFDFLTRNFSPYFLNPYNFNLLHYILSKKIDFKNIRHNKIKLFLCATNVKTGMLKIFDNSSITADSILASACLPNLFQAVNIDNEYYWDGGYLGNPAIFPLIYNSDVNDIVIIHNNPIVRDTVPTDSADITNRINEISFNSTMLRELRVVAFISSLIDKAWLKDEYKELLRKKYIHIIRSDEVMNQFNLINKYNWSWDFISYLFDLGKMTAENWLKINFDHIGKKPTIDFYEFLSGDTQTLR